MLGYKGEGYHASSRANDGQPDNWLGEELEQNAVNDGNDDACKRRVEVNKLGCLDVLDPALDVIETKMKNDIIKVDLFQMGNIVRHFVNECLQVWEAVAAHEVQALVADHVS